MSKIAGIKGHSPEAYPDTPFNGGIASDVTRHNPAVTLTSVRSHQPPRRQAGPRSGGGRTRASASSCSSPGISKTRRA